jgi:hypothetical protein
MSARRTWTMTLAVLGLALTALAGVQSGAAQAPESDDSADLPIESMQPLEQPAPPAKPEPAPAPAAPAPSWQPRAMAELSALDKIDDRWATLNVPVGGAIQFGRLSIAVRACLARGPGQAVNAAAFLQVADTQPGGSGFTGWMLMAEPSVAMLQDPVYDLRVVACR